MLLTSNQKKFYLLFTQSNLYLHTNSTLKSYGQKTGRKKQD